MECVSPIIESPSDCDYIVHQFWKAIKASHTPARSPSCGTHVYVAPLGRAFTLAELKKIAFACCYYEPYVVSCIPRERRDLDYCQRNSHRADKMGRLVRSRSSAAINTIASEIRGVTGRQGLIRYIQGGLGHESRRAIWNFQNTQDGHKGTIEFRGGRQMLGPHRTIRWINFAISFVLMALHEVSNAKHAFVHSLTTV